MKVWVVRDGERGHEDELRVHASVDGAANHIKAFIRDSWDGDFVEDFSSIELESLNAALESPQPEPVMHWWREVGHKCSHLNILFEEKDLEP